MLAYASPAGLGEESVQVYLPHAVFHTIVQSNGTGGYSTNQPKGMIHSEDSPGGMIIQKSSAAPKLKRNQFYKNKCQVNMNTKYRPRGCTSKGTHPRCLYASIQGGVDVRGFLCAHSASEYCQVETVDPTIPRGGRKN